MLVIVAVLYDFEAKKYDNIIFVHQLPALIKYVCKIVIWQVLSNL